jgi:hypothetical protein
MNGRYGIDDIYKDGLILYIILVILNIFVKSTILNVLQLILILTLLYRAFSKQVNIRIRENNKYLKIKRKMLKPIKDIKKYLKDDYHIYKKCHHCNTILKLPIPNKRGIKHSKCPTCKKRNTFIILKKLKVEIIKNKKI